MLILCPFGPVALVYDVMDTVGRDLPQDVASFFAYGSINENQLVGFKPRVEKKNIEWRYVDAGDKNAGAIRVIERATIKEEATRYRMIVNRNHSPAVQFATITHELGHLFLGHLGPDKKLNIPERPITTHDQRELEAESVAYIVCERNGIKSKSESYLNNYVNENITVDNIDVYQVMRASGQVEALLGLTAHTRYEKPA